MSGQDARGEGRGRRRGHGAARSTGPSLAHVPRRLENPWEPLTSLSEEAVEAILGAAFRILEEGGIEFRSARALDLLRRAGAAPSNDGLVRMGREMVEHHLALAPRKLTLHSRNPGKAVHMGGQVVNFCAANGAPNVSDRLRERRYGDYASLCEIIGLNNALGAVHISGFEVVEPTDIPVPLRPVHMAYAHIANGDLVWAARDRAAGGGGRRADGPPVARDHGRGAGGAALLLCRHQLQFPPAPRRGAA